jgi:hypothetical protein
VALMVHVHKRLSGCARQMAELKPQAQRGR